MPSVRHGIVGAVTAMVACVAGCNRTIVHVQPAMPDSAARLVQPVPFAAVIEQVSMTVDGFDHTAPVALGQRLASRLRVERVFANVFNPGNAEFAPPESARLHVHITTKTERNRFANGMRKVFIMSSMLLLFPLIPFEYDLESTLVGTLALPDGRTQTYRATTSLTRESGNEEANDEMWDLEARALSMNIDALVANLKTDPLLNSWPREGALP